jgi:hypothetical protein
MEIDSQWKPELIDLSEVEGAFGFEEGFSRPDWRIIRKAIQQKEAELAGANDAWDEVVRQWMLQLRSDLGGEYGVAESGGFFLLASVDSATRTKILDFSETVLSQIRERLGDAAWNLRHGKHVILLFTEEDDYYQYVSYYYPEGTHPRTGGCLIHKDYVHIAVPYDPLSLRRTLAHELAHNCVVHLRLPLWLNEGLAQMFERGVATMQPFLLDFELKERHVTFWNEQSIQEFWSGVSFRKPGDSNELSYSLAEIILSLLQEHSGSWSAFVKQARWEDGGQTAAIECLSVDLGDVMGTFLGEGDWRPRRKAMVELWEAWKKKDKSELEPE